MDFIKKLLADALHGFDLADIPLFCFRFFMAAILVYVLRLSVNKKSDIPTELNQWLVPISALAAIIALASEVSIGLSILFIPVFIMMVPFKMNWNYSSQILLALSVAIGLLCGAGYVFLAALITLLLLPIIWLRPKQ